jgi:D-glycero-alpha-D-manno-heptose-7-phosphate kinase
MIITRSPLRISLGGGGTDLPSYYRQHGGFLIAAAIDRYVMITLHDTFQEELIIRYSRMERVSRVDQIEHPIIREALRLLGDNPTRLELISMADIPAGTGLGSSGSFTTALLQALHARRQTNVTKAELAEQACHIELDLLKEPIGKQDQYIAAFGGVTCFTFNPDGTVAASRLNATRETLYNLEDSLVMFFTGYSRKASDILREQDTKSRGNDQGMIENLHFVKDLGLRTQAALEAGEVHRLGPLMHEHWNFKKQRSAGMSNPDIDGWYELAMRSGATGGKLIGAGGGGFLMFYAEDKRRLRHALTEAGLTEVRLRFDYEGTKVVHQ